jgi:type IV pilus assembly protein PilN
MRITLNLATRPFADIGPAIKRLRIAMGLLALLAILLGVGLRAIHHEAELARAHDHSLDGQIAKITQEQQTDRALMNQPDNQGLLKQAAVLNQLIDEKAFSWTLAMEDLETVLPGGVQVTALEPARQKDGHIAVKLRVVGPRDRAVDLVRNLEHSRRFLLPRIVGENAEANDKAGQRIEPVSAQDRVEFELAADYNPATPEERKAARKAPIKLPEPLPQFPAPSRSTRPVVPAPGVGRPPYVGPQITSPHTVINPRPNPQMMRMPPGDPTRGATPIGVPTIQQRPQPPIPPRTQPLTPPQIPPGGQQ